MLARFGERIQFDGVNLYVFWPSSSVATADETELREIKVGYRAKSFLRVPQFFSERPDVEDEVRLLSREEAAKRLREIYGVGPATAWYLLLESLKHWYRSKVLAW
jgi:3-methyladenine DNA glycosylase/8-oxoguanine DNA glycosylase